jgi:hypothetical protein
MEYFDIMCEIIEGNGSWSYGNPIHNAIVGDQNRRSSAQEAIALFKQNDDGSVPDGWISMVERYKHRITRYNMRDNNNSLLRDNLPKIICDDLFRIVKPCKITEVPIGTLTNDRYKGWYR